MHMCSVRRRIGSPNAGMMSNSPSVFRDVRDLSNGMEEHVEPKISDQELNVTTEHTGEGENKNLSCILSQRRAHHDSG
jgi:hypothetical protein